MQQAATEINRNGVRRGRADKVVRSEKMPTAILCLAQVMDTAGMADGMTARLAIRAVLASLQSERGATYHKMK